MAKNNFVYIQAGVDPEVKQKVDTAARNMGTNTSALVAELIMRWLEAQTNKTKD